MERNNKKDDRKIIKCTGCGFKYYEGDVHECLGASVKEKPREKKLTVKAQKEPFKIWKDNQKKTLG